MLAQDHLTNLTPDCRNAALLGEGTQPFAMPMDESPRCELLVPLPEVKSVDEIVLDLSVADHSCRITWAGTSTPLTIPLPAEAEKPLVRFLRHNRCANIGPL